MTDLRIRKPLKSCRRILLAVAVVTATVMPMTAAQAGGLTFAGNWNSKHFITDHITRDEAENFVLQCDQLKNVYNSSDPMQYVLVTEGIHANSNDNTPHLTVRIMDHRANTFTCHVYRKASCSCLPN
jgi:hypothetical protein